MTANSSGVREHERRPGGGRGALEQSRWLVHAGLIGTFIASLVVLVFNLAGTTGHVFFGSAFAGLVVIHLWQRRRTMRRLARALARASSWLRPTGRMATADLVLAFITLDVVVSGVADLLRGQDVLLPLHDIGIPVQLSGWHRLSSLVLAVFLVVHVSRRRRRLQSSHIH